MRAYSLYEAQCGCIILPDFWPVEDTPEHLHARVIKDCTTGSYTFGTHRTMMTNREYPKPVPHDEAERHWANVQKLVDAGYAYAELRIQLKRCVE